MVTSGLASGRVSIQVAAIETRSLPSSLAAARRGFTFYLADPSARLTSIAKAVRVNRPYQNLAVQVNRRYHFCNGALTAQTTRSRNAFRRAVRRDLFRHHLLPETRIKSAVLRRYFESPFRFRTDLS